MADFYGTAAGFNAYRTARGRDALDGNPGTPEIEAALLVASEWVDRSYGAQFSGYKTGRRSQLRSWPRTGAYESVDDTTFGSGEIPVEIDQATYEAAERQLVSPGVLSIDYTPGQYKRVSVDGAVSVEYANFSYASEIQTQFTLIDQILWPLLNVNGDGLTSPYSGSVIRV